MEDVTSDASLQELAFPVVSVEMGNTTADAATQEPASPIGSIKEERMKIENMVDATSASIDNYREGLQPTPLEQMNLRFEEESVGDVATQEPNHPSEKTWGLK